MVDCPNCRAAMDGAYSVCPFCAKPTGYSGTNDAGETNQSTAATLIQRGKRYGDFKGNATLSCQLRDLIMNHRRQLGKTDMPFIQREAINMICAKLARIANGDPAYDDNFRDIAGFAQLVVDELNKDK